MIRFTKARASPPHKTTSKQAALDKLVSFLNGEEPKTVRWLVSFWNEQSAAITYADLREAVLSGDITQDQLELWQQDYARLVSDHFAPQWEKAMSTAATERTAQFPAFHYDPAIGAAQEYIQQHGAELVTRMTQVQRDALRAMIAQSAQYNSLTADELARMMRPVIGLTEPQAKANLRYYAAVKETLLKTNPNMRLETAEKRARDAAAKYASRQNRERAFAIARTELATAYGRGAYYATKDAQERGYLGDCTKTWLTAADGDRVCKVCRAVDGETVNMNDLFSVGVLTTPLHPCCRCSVEYNEIDPPVTPALVEPGTEIIIE